MTDRELLKLAAKAVGRPVPQDGPHAGIDERGMYTSNIDDTRREYWAPLTDDGDALRLAVALQAVKGSTWAICLSIGADRSACEFHYACGPDPAANARRAIVIAAAEHAKAMLP